MPRTRSALAVLLWAPVLVLSLATPLRAGSNPDAELALDCRPHDAARTCATVSGCDGIQYRYGGSGDYDIVVVAYRFTGMRAIDYRLDYSGVADAEFIDFTSCSSLAIRYPEPGVYEILQAWSTCQLPSGAEDAGMVVGWLRITGGAGTIRIEPTVSFGVNEIVDCDFASDVITRTHDGFVGGAAPGPGFIEPCGGPTPAEEVTWSRVKGLYR